MHIKSVTFAGDCSVGERESQQDYFGFIPPEVLGDDDSLLLLLADGMGGYAGGDVASREAVETFATEFYRCDEMADRPRLLQALTVANDRIGRLAAASPELAEMGTTFVAALVRGRTLRWVSVGDSPLYLYRARELDRLNAEHSMRRELDHQVAAGLISPSEAAGHPGRSRLLSALIGEEIREIDAPVDTIELADGDVVVACSDGILSLDRHLLLRRLEIGLEEDALVLARRILRDVESRRQDRQDNTTVAIVKIGAGNEDSSLQEATSSEAELPLLPQVAMEVGDAGSDRAALVPPSPTMDEERPMAPSAWDETEREEEHHDVGRSGPNPWRRWGAVVATAVIIVTAILVGTWLDKTNMGLGMRASTTLAPAPLSAPAAPTFSESRDMEGSRAGEVREFAGIEMVWCPPGEFLMGSPESEEGREDDETQYRVTLTKGFWMAKTETKQEQWQTLMGGNPSSFKGDNLPVEQVRWDDVQGWLTKMNGQNALPSGWKWSLPTEAQWEYACRAGTTTMYAGDLNDMAWYNDNSGSETNPVASKKPNAWGLYDMHGNVWEWCADYYGDYASGSATDPKGATSGDHRVFRGGSWYSNAGLCRAAYRSCNSPAYRHFSLGFRPALVPSKQ